MLLTTKKIVLFIMNLVKLDCKSETIYIIHIYFIVERERYVCNYCYAVNYYYYYILYKTTTRNGFHFNLLIS